MMYTHKSYGMGFKYTISPEDKRYVKLMKHDGTLHLVDVGPIEHGLTFFDVIRSAAIRSYDTLETIMYTDLFKGFTS